MLGGIVRIPQYRAMLLEDDELYPAIVVGRAASRPSTKLPVKNECISISR